MSTEITTDGKTVWVNSEHGCIGRFTNRLAEVMQNPNSEKFSTYQSEIGMSGDKNWEWFQKTMLDKHNVTVPDELKPETEL